MDRTIQSRYASYNSDTDIWESENRITKGKGIDGFNAYNKERKLIDKIKDTIKKTESFQTLNNIQQAKRERGM